MTAATSLEYDMIVVGGGPAGATAATLVAERGHRVLLLERSEGPRFKIGESLMPATYWTLDRLGLLERMKQSAFPVKQSVQFFSSSGRASTPFYFTTTDPHESSRTWQVVRSEFDRMLLDNAVEKGVDVRFGDAVTAVLFDGERAVGVEVRSAGGESARLGCRVVVDASGQRTMLARQLGLKEEHPELRSASYYTHFEGAVRGAGVDEGATLIFHTRERDSWFWFIPLPEDRCSVGVVGPIDYLVKGRRRQPQAVFDEELALCPALAERLDGARQMMEMKVTRDFSYRSRRLAGDGWVLVGDAYSFVDPIYSAGVFLALESGSMAADCILEGLEDGDLSAARLGSFGARYDAGIEAVQKLVYAFYDRDFSFGRFLRRHPECREDIVHILIGNIFRRSVDGLFEPLERFRRETAGSGDRGGPEPSGTTPASDAESPAIDPSMS